MIYQIHNNMATTGKIGVTTENIFPVIKKFLYSDHEIFLRELVANAVDATQKMKALAASGEFSGELGELGVRIELDEKKKTLKVIDNGIGMTSEEVDKYINQIAFSSAGEFLEKYKDQLSSIIGHFGLGFYSAFMVAEKVTIETLSWKDGSKAVKWSCDGSPAYEMTEIDKADRGTDIVLYIDDENKEFLEENGAEMPVDSTQFESLTLETVDGKQVITCSGITTEGLTAMNDLLSDALTAPDPAHPVWDWR